MANSRGVRDILKINRKTFFNPSAWLDLGALTELNSTIVDVLRTALALPKRTPGEPPKTETFNEAVKRLDLTEKDLASSATSYRLFAILFCVLGILDLAYTFYILIFHHSFLGTLLGLSTSALFFGQAFRFDFWSYQIRRRKLGVTFKEWRQSLLGNKGKTS